MNEQPNRWSQRAALALGLVALATASAGCAGDDDSEKARKSTRHNIVGGQIEKGRDNVGLIPTKYGYYDVAVLLLAQPVDLAPSTFATSLDEGLVGVSVVAVGFGKTDGSAQASRGTKKSAELVVSSFEELQFGIGAPGNTICNGDSGGPMFAMVDGVERIVGLSSWGKSGCTGEAYAARTDVAADFIAQAAGVTGSEGAAPGEIGDEGEGEGGRDETPDDGPTDPNELPPDDDWTGEGE